MWWVSLGITLNIIKISVISLVISSLIGWFIPSYSGAKKSILESMWW
jgi:hypothetical protein